MSKNFFYADLDMINGKGVLITGHGKGIVNKNSNINGGYIAADMVRLIAKNDELYGYQGYLESEDDELTKIEYLLYFFAQSELNQPMEPSTITAETYLSLSKHNIDTGEILNGKPSQTYSEYEDILKQVNKVHFIS
ncbi:hypothetical protein V7183_25745, partial [Bacillus sp. JJ1127]|uniref:hypothetical protein n=1 Tax=Bacillus sp. JJ1127 TaxID=3122952 RepID=UPI002FFF0207